MRNIGSFSGRARSPVQADVLIDVWMFKEGYFGIELNVHPDDIEDVSTCVMISGSALADLAEAISLIANPESARVAPDNVIPLAPAESLDAAMDDEQSS